jgi:hypothetical protein
MQTIGSSAAEKHLALSDAELVGAVGFPVRALTDQLLKMDDKVLAVGQNDSSRDPAPEWGNSCRSSAVVTTVGQGRQWWLLRQMILGLVMDGAGWPVCTEMWPGNTADVTVLLPIIDRLRQRFGIGRVCVVADRGMISAETISGLEARGLDYILGAREHTDKLVRQIVAGLRAGGGRPRGAEGSARHEWRDGAHRLSDQAGNSDRYRPQHRLFPSAENAFAAGMMSTVAGSAAESDFPVKAGLSVVSGEVKRMIARGHTCNHVFSEHDAFDLAVAAGNSGQSGLRHDLVFDKTRLCGSARAIRGADLSEARQLRRPLAGSGQKTAAPTSAPR